MQSPPPEMLQSFLHRQASSVDVVRPLEPLVASGLRVTHRNRGKVSVFWLYLRLSPDPSVRTTRHLGLLSVSPPRGNPPEVSRESYLRILRGSLLPLQIMLQSQWMTG
eukprot:COSAG03_NODE_1487_length_3993_cov_6.510786_1_plen_107_part_10